MTIPYEPTRSYAYRAARYELLPKLVELAKPFGETSFLLRDLWQPLLQETYTQEQLNTLIPRAQATGSETLRAILGFNIPFLADPFFERLGGGMFRNIPLEEEIEEVEAAAVAADTESDGLIYAYTFPSIRKENGDRFPIKIGLTATGDAKARVMQQCKTTCCFEYPVLLAVWRVNRVGEFESALHSILATRGHKRDAPGAEWFDTTLEEVSNAIMFVQPSAQLLLD
jgi:hypothetical protein